MVKNHITHNMFDKLADNGYLAELIPIAPPGANILPSSSLANEKIGKTPGKYLANRGMWCGFSGWQRHETTITDIQEWKAFPGVGIGLRTGKHVGIDIDILDEVLAKRVDLEFQLELGFAPCRIGKAPKRLLLYRMDGETRSKINIEFTGNISGKIEILAAGNQFVAYLLA